MVPLTAIFEVKLPSSRSAAVTPAFVSNTFPTVAFLAVTPEITGFFPLYATPVEAKLFFITVISLDPFPYKSAAACTRQYAAC